ncbi:MAG: DUF1992 domain-containing protein [Pyrinomonadaceae bacterium]
MNRLESLTEKAIREAIEKGEFDDLAGKGKPVDLKENPFEDPDLRVVHRLLRNAGFAPAWIEERKAIDAELIQAQTTLSRAWTLFGKAGQTSANSEWERCVAEFKEKIVELNQRVRMYNLKAPAVVFHRRLVDAENAIAEITGPIESNR